MAQQRCCVTLDFCSKLWVQVWCKPKAHEKNGYSEGCFKNLNVGAHLFVITKENKQNQCKIDYQQISSGALPVSGSS